MINMGEVFTFDRIGDVKMERVQMSEREISRFSVQPLDLMFARQSMVEAGAGKCSVVTKIEETTCFESHLIRVRLDQKQADPLYYYYCFRSPIGHSRIGAIVTGAAQKGIRGSELKDLSVPRPPFPAQRRIASILSAYDDLIENNTRRIAILEEMARRLYEEWFVQFRFPGHEEVHFKESEVGRLPQSWICRPLEEVVEMNPRIRVPKEEEKPFVPMGSLSESSMVIGETERKSGKSGAKFQNGDTLVARITPCLENGKTGFVNFLPDNQTIACGSTEFIVLRSHSLCPEMVYLMASSNKFRDVAIKSMSGATGRQRVRLDSLKSFPVIQPDDQTLRRFQAFAAPCFQHIRVLSDKNTNLRAQRDLLLPKLVSGEIDVSDMPLPDPQETKAA